MVIFVGFIGISIPYLIFPPLFLNFEYSFLSSQYGDSIRPLFLGITLAAYPLGQFIGSPILGALSDEYGRKYLLSGSLIVSSACNWLTAIAIAKQDLVLLIISRFMCGLMEGNVAIARAMCADLKMLPKHKTFGKINAAASIAYLFGPLLGGVLTDKKLFDSLTLSTPFYLISGLFLFLSVLSTLTLKNSIAPLKKRSLWEQLNFFSRASALFSNKTLKFLLITSTCFTLAVDIFYEFGPVYLTAKWMLTPSQLIVYNGVLCIGLAIGNGWFPGFVSSRVSNRLPMMGAMGAFSFFLLSIVYSNSTLLMLTWFTLSGLVIGLAVTLLTVQISNSVPDSVQGEVMGTQISLRVLGDGLICLVGGALFILSPKIILIAAAIISLGAILYFAARNRIRTQGNDAK